jgi:AraC-like DNA-binding protein
MNFDSQLLFFFSALGAFNSLLLSFYFFFFAKSKGLSKYFLGGLLAALSIRIGKSVFFYFNPALAKIYLQIGLSACFFIGPFLYLYTKSKITSLEKFKANWYYSLLIFLLFLVISVGYLYPYQIHQELWTDFYKIIYYQWLVCIIVSGFILKNTFKKLFIKSIKLNYNDIWVLSVFFGVSMIWIAYFVASYTSYIIGALSFSFVLYLSLLLILYQRKKNFPVPVQKEKYLNSKIEETEAQRLLKKIETLMNEEELYKNSNLNLSQVAKRINIHPHLLSQLLNDNLNKNFSQFINEYRIKEAKVLLKSNSNLKIEIIGEICGFNSNSTFYAAFKKITKTTPAKFISNK